MLPRHRSLTSLVALLALSATTAAAQKANDRSIGTWTFNAGKSKYTAPSVAPKSGTRMYEVVGGKLHSTGQTVKPDGTVDKYEFTAAYDGKDAPYKGPAGDKISITQINDHAVEATLKKAGKVVQTTRREVSADGKTMTMTTKLTGADNKTTTNVAVYDKK